MRGCHSKMHAGEAKGRRQFSQNSQEICNFWNDLGLKRGRAENWPPALSPLKKQNDYSYFPTPVHSVIRTGWPFLTMVGYRLSKPLWSDAL
jgi:hypothetical protein